MRRSLSTPQTVVVLGTALAVGLVVGVVGHSLTRSADAGGTATAESPTRTATPTRSSTSSAILGPGNVLATDDFSRVGWNQVSVETEVNGEPQFAYACQRRRLGAMSATPTGTISATWNLQGTFTAAQTVADFAAPPQARTTFKTLTGWYRHCGHSPAPSKTTALLRTVHVEAGTARLWRIKIEGDPGVQYGIIALRDSRLGIIDLYDDQTPPDPAGLEDLARQALARLG